MTETARGDALQQACAALVRAAIAQADALDREARQAIDIHSAAVIERDAARWRALAQAGEHALKAAAP